MRCTGPRSFAPSGQRHILEAHLGDMSPRAVIPVLALAIPRTGWWPASAPISNAVNLTYALQRQCLDLVPAGAAAPNSHVNAPPPPLPWTTVSVPTSQRGSALAGVFNAWSKHRHAGQAPEMPAALPLPSLARCLPWQPIPGDRRGTERRRRFPLKLWRVSAPVMATRSPNWRSPASFALCQFGPGHFPAQIERRIVSPTGVDPVPESRCLRRIRPRSCTCWCPSVNRYEPSMATASGSRSP